VTAAALGHRPDTLLLMDDFYRENILDHYKNPRNPGHLDNPTATADGVNPLCGDELSVELLVEDGVVKDIRYNGHGCAISQAAASMLSEVVKGRPVAELSGLGKDDVLEELGIPLMPIRLKCALLSVGVLKVALGEMPGEDPSDGIEWKSG
jgi:nitrogen fixation NifU-like protein